jgi:type I restriction enzyme S subunit
LQNGRAFKPEEWSDAGTPIIRIQNLNDESKPFNYCSFEVEPRFHIKTGDLLFSWSGTPGTSFGAFFWNRGKGFLNQHIFRVDVDESQVSKNYLCQALNAQLPLIMGQAHGGVGLQHITKGKLESIEIRLPPLPEQQRIASIVEQADALRVKRREALAQLDELQQGIFIEMFGDPAEHTSCFKTLPLQDVLEEGFQNGAYFPRDAYSENGVEMVHMSDAFGGLIQRGNLKRVKCSASEIEKYSLKPSDLIIARRSLTYDGAARPCMVPEADEPLLFESSFIRVRANRKLIEPLFLFHYLNNDRVREKFVRPYVTQSTISGINQANLSKIPVMLVPLTMQLKFKDRISSVQSLKKRHAASAKELDALFISLQHRAFQGEL